MKKMMIAAAALAIGLASATGAQAAGSANGILNFSETANYRIPPAQMHATAPAYTNSFQQVQQPQPRSNALKAPSSVQMIPGTNRIMPTR